MLRAALIALAFAAASTAQAATIRLTGTLQVGAFGPDAISFSGDVTISNPTRSAGGAGTFDPVVLSGLTSTSGTVNIYRYEPISPSGASQIALSNDINGVGGWVINAFSRLTLYDHLRLNLPWTLAYLSRNDSGVSPAADVQSALITAALIDGSIDDVRPNVRPPTPGVVPLPAAAWLLLAGVGGLAALRRRGASRNRVVFRG